MRGTGALARASMADLKPDRVRAAELAQTGAGRGRARGEKIEREHESTRTLFEHLNPSELAVVPSGMRPKNFVGIESLVSVGVGSSERESRGGGVTDSCSEIVFVETATKLGKGGKKKKSGAARRRRKKERTDASLALFEAEAADNARLGALAVVARVLHKVRNLSKSVIKWNVCFASEMARWAAQDAAVTAVWAAERAEDEAQWVAQEVTLTLKIREMVSKGLVRRRRGRRGVGRGRRKRRLEGRERQRGRQEQMRRAWEREGWRRAELQWAQRQDARWRSKGGKGASWRLRQRKQRRRRRATASNAMQRLPARGIGPGTGRQGPLQRGVGRASRRQRQKRLRAGKGGAGASGQQQRRLGGGGKRGWVT